MQSLLLGEGQIVVWHRKGATTRDPTDMEIHKGRAYRVEGSFILPATPLVMLRLVTNASGRTLVPTQTVASVALCAVDAVTEQRPLPSQAFATHPEPSQQTPMAKNTFCNTPCLTKKEGELAGKRDHLHPFTPTHHLAQGPCLRQGRYTRYPQHPKYPQGP